MEVDLPVHKVTISGPTLSAILNRFSSSPSSISGHLLGRFSLLPPTLSDSDTDSSPSSSLVATLTGFTSDQRHNPIGFFSARRKCPLRPSLNDFALCHSLSSNSPQPTLFLLITTPFPDHQTLIHTLDYRVYHFRPRSGTFDALQLDVVNIGPAFRGQYSAFCPNSEIPFMLSGFREGGSPMREDEKEKGEGKGKEKESLSELKKISKDQKDLSLYAEGYEIGSLSRLMGSEAVSYMGGVEELYEKMLAKLECLARLAETSSAKVLEQENYNMMLRRRVSGLE